MPLRLFVGVRIPENDHPVLQSLQSGLPDARWVGPENFHITLRFIGEVEGTQARDIALGLARVKAEPFAFKLLDLDFFGRRRPRSLWAGVDPKHEISNLAEKVDMALGHCNVMVEARKYTPHVTLAYLKGTNEHEVTNYIAERSPFQGPNIHIAEFLLMSSVLGSEGASHRVEETYPLSP